MSAPVAITVLANNPPTVSLSSPGPTTGAWAPAVIVLNANSADSDGTVGRVEFYSASALIGNATAAPYTFTWTGVPAGTHTLTARAFDDLGATTTSSPLTVVVQGAQLAITEPVAGAALAGDSVLIKGTYFGPPNSGVTVNGTVAVLAADNRYYAAVPLQPGANSIGVVLTTQGGQTTTQSIEVISDGVPAPIQISADGVEGVQALTVTFTISGEGAIPGNIQVSGGAVTVTQEADKVLVSYPAAGTYPTRLTASDAQGNTVQKDFVIVVQDATLADQRLKALWGGMNTALASGNKDVAMSYLSGAAQDKYGPVFDALAAQMPEIISSLSPPQTGALSADVGEYAVNRMEGGTNMVFFVYFVRGADGVWRMDSM